jgi:transcription antitermination protein NusB
MSRRPPGAGSQTRKAARLACVQVLYEIDVSGAGSDPVLREFLTDRWSNNVLADAMAAPDRSFLRRLVFGVDERMADLDRVISAALSPDHAINRLEVLLRAVLRAATYELIAMPEVPAKVVINEYMDVAHAFFSGSEPALVNGVLDRIARESRASPRDMSADEKP